MFYGRGHIEQPFLIDTGSDYTILQPTSATRLIAAPDQDRQALRAQDVINVTGIGNAVVRATVRRVGLLVRDELGEAYWFPQSILFADIGSSQAQLPTRNVPSILGRDVLRRFDLNLSYDPPSISLTLNQ